MAVPNITSGNLIASISDHLPQFLVAPNILLMPFTLNPIVIRETGQDLINKILCLIISQSNEIIFSTNTEKSYKTFLEKFGFLLDTYASQKKKKKKSKNKLRFKD